MTSDERVDSDRVAELSLRALRHRGPDDEGSFRAQAGEYRVGLTHTRLSIVDLSPAGHQPASTADGRFTITYNGMVYNFREIRAELESLGERFHSSCDTEVVLKAYARWGREALGRFRGMFAFAIWDAEQRKLFMARDRLGVKPLYVAPSRTGLAFASEVRALLQTGFAQRQLSRRALGSYLSFGAVSGPETILDGVMSLPPGTWLEWRDGHTTTAPYWELPLEANRSASFESEVAAIVPILGDAVRLRMIADVPIGIFLSGGIDSSALVALATRATSSPVHTFTVTFDEKAFSEAPFAAEVARRYGCDHHQVHLPASQAVHDIGDALGALDQPSVDGVNTYFVSRAARRSGLTVALSGLGGDELFAGYSYFHVFGRLRRLARIARGMPEALRRGAHVVEGTASAPTPVRKLAAILGGDGSLPATYGGLRAMFTLQERQALLREGLEEPGYLGVTVLDDLAARDRRGDIDPVNALSALELTNYLRHTLLRDTDAMSMAHPIEVRVPFLDHVLVERVMRAPGPLKLSVASNKPMLTAAVPGMPENAIRRAKMGFTLPWDTWFRGPLKPWMEAILLGDAPRRLGLFNPASVERLWGSFLKGDRYTTFARVWCIAALTGWCEANGVSP